MTGLRTIAGRSKKTAALIGILLAASAGSLIAFTQFRPAFAADGSVSTTLAELAARSPGARIGGIALKAKTKRRAPVALAKAAPPATPGRGAPIASVMSAPPVDSFGAPAPGFGPGIASTEAVTPAPLPVPGGSTGVVPGPGGGVIIGPGPGGGTGVTPEPTPTPPVVTPTTPPTNPPVAAVPEPGTWLMMITGFGFVGGAMRSRRRIRRLA